MVHFGNIGHKQFMRKETPKINREETLFEAET